MSQRAHEQRMSLCRPKAALTALQLIAFFVCATIAVVQAYAGYPHLYWIAVLIVLAPALLSTVSSAHSLSLPTQE